MTERLRTEGYSTPVKVESDLSPRKTLIVLVIVVGCFAVLWPKVFYPMLVGSANQQIKPSAIDKTTGCCDVISEIDVHTIKILNELCGSIINRSEVRNGKEFVQKCRNEILETCGIDIEAVLQEQVRLGNVKQILEEIRSLNGSLCLKYNYGVAPWRLGVPHRITVKLGSSDQKIRQERPPRLQSEMIHPAFRERGRAIPQPQSSQPRPPSRVIEGRPGPLPGMRPTIGGAGHVVPPSKHQSTSSMSIIMPIYTIGIVIFFTYTLMRIIFKKQPDGDALYPPIEPDPHFRREVFESERSRLTPRQRDNVSNKIVVNAMSALLDEVDQEIEARHKTNELGTQELANGNLSNGTALKPQDEQPTVKVLGMEMTASCEGGKKWTRPDSPVMPTPVPPQLNKEPTPPPQEIYLEGALPAQSHLLVTNSATESEKQDGEDPAVVLAGKVTLSVVNLDENGSDVEGESNGHLQELHSEKHQNNVEEILEKALIEATEKEPEAKISNEIIENINTVLYQQQDILDIVNQDDDVIPELEHLNMSNDEIGNILEGNSQNIVEELDNPDIIAKRQDFEGAKQKEEINEGLDIQEVKTNGNLQIQDSTEHLNGTQSPVENVEINDKPILESNEQINEHPQELTVVANEEEIQSSIDPLLQLADALDDAILNVTEQKVDVPIEDIQIEVDSLIQEAIGNITQAAPANGNSAANDNQMTEEIVSNGNQISVPNGNKNIEQSASNDNQAVIEIKEVSTDDEDLGSDEEIVDEIEEVVYEEEVSEEEEEVTDDEEEEEKEVVNGVKHENKYPTVGTAEDDVSDDEEEADTEEEVDENDFLGDNQNFDSSDVEL